MAIRRRNPLLFEKDGSLNPTWIFAGCYLIVGLILIGIAAWLSLELRSPVPVLAALAFTALCIAMLLIGALPLSKAKVLAESRVVEEGFRALGGAVHFGGSTEPWDDGEPFDYEAERGKPRSDPQ